VLETACRQAKSWLDQGLRFDHVSVNLSCRQFQDLNLLARIQEILERTGLETRYLELEITESAVMSNAAQAEQILGELKAMGVRLAVDDFGTGYSSLCYLKRLPIDVLKIDRGFITDLSVNVEDKAIVEAIVNLSHTLGLTTVAEGIELECDADLLRQLGCGLGQGYLFSKPLCSEEAAQWLKIVQERMLEQCLFGGRRGGQAATSCGAGLADAGPREMKRPGVNLMILWEEYRGAHPDGYGYSRSHRR